MITIVVTESNGKRRAIGTVQDGVYTKNDAPQGNRVLNALNAIGIDSNTWTKTFNNGQKILAILARDDEGNRLRISSEKVRGLIESGDVIYKHFKPHRAQLFIPLQFWDKEPTIRQGGLF